MPALYPPSRPQSVGEVLDLAFRIFGSTLLRCLPFGVLAMVAGQLQSIYDIVTRHPLRQFGGKDPAWWAMYALGAFLAFACINVIFLRQHAMASGSGLTTRALLAEGLRRAPAATAVFVLMLSAMAVFIAPVVAMPRGLQTWALLVLSVPSSYAGVALSCAWPSLLIGRKSVFASLGYSVHLVRGNWWRTTAILLVSSAMLAVLFVSAGVIIGMLMQFVAGGDVAVATAVSTVMVAAMGAIYVPFLTSTALALYGDLEARKEGKDLERRIAGAAAG